ncbi:MAG: helix-turn-helix domain-containing protein [Victivallaceae bacterium]|nr:helix-turn-helix domain-containing protein [Victivallaceae bacterium]
MNSKPKGVPVKSVKKALDILDILLFDDFTHHGLGLFEIAKQMDLQPNTTHNLLKTLSACGYIAQNADSKYTIGHKCHQIGINNFFASETKLENQIFPILQNANKTIQESIVLATLSNGRRIPVLRAEHSHLIKLDYDAINNANIFSLSTGRILTAFADDNELAEIINTNGFPKEQWDNIGNMQQLTKTIKPIKQDGYIVVEDQELGLVTFAYPILTTSGRLIGAIGCYAPLFRCPKTKYNTIITKLKQAANKIILELR